MRTMGKMDKGVAGLTILLSIVVFLFIIGFLVMVFSLMGGELRDATYTSTDVTVTNETGAWVNATTFTVANAGAQDFSNFEVTETWNATAGTEFLRGNLTTTTAGTFTNSSALNWANVTFSYTYTYNAENTATGVMNDTVVGVSGVVDWFDIFVVISAMVVLILLTVLIITAIRGSGLIGGGSA